MRPKLRTPSFSLLITACLALTACPDNNANNEQDSESSGDGGGLCMFGELGCICQDGACFGELECVANICIDPQCVPGSEYCVCAEGLCLGGLECADGICLPQGDQCTANDHYQCSFGNVHWVDSCGEIGEIKQECNEFQDCENTTDKQAECVSNNPDACGDGIIDPGEDCDGGNLGGQSCASLGFGGGNLVCQNNCVFDTSGCSDCGNGILDPGEECDGTNFGGKTCSTFGLADGAALACTDDCTIDTGPCETCGNGVIDPGEDCDGNNLGGGTCEGQGYNGGGDLSCAANCQYDEGQCENCECLSGVCCDGCNYFGPQVECQANADTEYGCPSGTDPGDDVSRRTRDRFCSGSSSSCDGSFGPWSGWQVHDQCSDNEFCTPGDSSCNPCTYDVTQYECTNFSSASGSGPGGGEIFRVCATTNSQTGYMTVKARKSDGSSFGSRPYQVRVSAVGDDPCGPNAYYFVISDSDPVNIGTNEITFSFPAQWQPGQTQKAYCVTASTKPGDLGYDGNNPQQQSWWYSKKAVVNRQCN